MKTKETKHLLLSGILFTLVIVLWPVFMAISQPEGTDPEKLQWIMQNLTLFKVQFFFAFLLSPVLIYLMISQMNMVADEKGRTDIPGFIFLGAYFTLNSISYGTQFAVLPGFIKAGSLEMASALYFNSGASFTYFLNQMGYFFWAAGVVILFFKFIRLKGMIKTISIIYFLSAVLSFIAFAGLAIGNDFLNSMTVFSGMILLPVGIISIVWSFKNK